MLRPTGKSKHFKSQRTAPFSSVSKDEAAMTHDMVENAILNVEAQSQLCSLFTYGL